MPYSIMLISRLSAVRGCSWRQNHEASNGDWQAILSLPDTLGRKVKHTFESEMHNPCYFALLGDVRDHHSAASLCPVIPKPFSQDLIRPSTTGLSQDTLPHDFPPSPPITFSPPMGQTTIGLRASTSQPLFLRLFSQLPLNTSDLAMIGGALPGPM